MPQSWAGLLQSAVTGVPTYIPTTTDFLDRIGPAAAAALIIGPAAAAFAGPAAELSTETIYDSLIADSINQEVTTMWPDEISVDPDTGDVWGGGIAGGPDVVMDPTTTGSTATPSEWMRGISQGTGVLQRTGILGAATGGLVSGAGAGLRTLGGMLGRGAARAGAYFTINGVRGSVAQLWKYTRALGPEAVAAGLGISVGALGEILLRNPERKGRGRRRGISARDIRTTKRVVNFVSRMAHQIGCVSTPRHFRRGRHATSH